MPPLIMSIFEDLIDIGVWSCKQKKNLECGNVL